MGRVHLEDAGAGAHHSPGEAEWQAGGVGHRARGSGRVSNARGSEEELTLAF